MSTHHLVVTETADSTPDHPDYKWRIACLTPATCTGWMTCAGDHSDAPDDPYDLEDGEVEIHGVIHEYHMGEWTIDFPGCVVAAAVFDWGSDTASDIAHDHGPGTHVVDNDWDDSDLTLIYIETVSGNEDES